MRKENVGLRGHKNQVDEVVGIVYVAVNINTTQLWDVKLQVTSDLRTEIRIDPAVLKLFDRTTFVSV